MSSKPLHICTLPWDVLEKVFLEFRLLASSLRDSIEATPEKDNISRCGCDVPIELLQCRLTCRSFYDVATPLMLWRLSIGPGCPKFMAQTEEICTFLEAHPEVGARIRYFSLHMDDSNPTSWYRILPLLTGLRALNVKITTSETNLMPLDVLRGLLSTSSLKTLVVIGPNRPFHFNLAISSVTHLYAFKTPQMTIEPSAGSSLESLWFDAGDALSDSSSSIRSAEIPWGTIKQLFVLTDANSKLMLAESFLSWRCNNLTKHPPLTELSISHRKLDPRLVDIVLLAFSSLPLTKLHLRGTPPLEAPHVDKIVTTFPRLTELTLQGHWDIFGPWRRESFDEYARALGKLEHLRILAWNFSMASSTEMLEALSPYCSSLVRVHQLPYNAPMEPLELRAFVVRHEGGSDGTGDIRFWAVVDPQTERNEEHGDINCPCRIHGTFSRPADLGLCSVCK